MPNSVAKRRSRFAILATLAVVASLFTAALPASAATGDVEFPATFSACVGKATADGGFTDTTGNFADASIDCLKYYGVTTGTTATTYSPGASVTRWQMALFLIRAAGPAGITVPAAASQGFTDIGGLAQSTQDAINQLAALGISKGTSTTTYAPNDIVSRYQMALFLIRFLEVQNGAATLATGSFGSGLTDLGNVSNEAFLAIEKAWDHGITKGTSATAFSPFDAVLRDQMAAFIARTLAHTNARPAGVSMQAVPVSGFSPLDVDVQISVRDTAFKPVANALVDVFEAALADKATAVKADGTCDGTKVSATDGATECAIDVADPDTDASGNIKYELTGVSASTIWWAWTGSTGATFDLDTTAVASAEVAVTAGATDWKVTDNVSDDAYDHWSSFNSSDDGTAVNFGKTVTLSFQLIDGDEKNVAKAGEKITIDVDRYVNGVYLGTVFTTLTTDATGLATISWTENDTNTAAWVSGSATDNVIEAHWDYSGTTLGIVDETDNAHFSYLWDDDAAEANQTVVSTNVDYTTGTVISASSKTTDQYGTGFAGDTVDWSIDGVFVQTRTTSSSGVTSQPVIGAAGADGDDVLVAAAGDSDSDSKTVYFVVVETDNAVGAALSIVAVDTANDAIVIDDGVGGFQWLHYDANDQFTTTVPTTLEAFETALDAGGAGNDQVTYTYRTSAAAVSSFDLS